MAPNTDDTDPDVIDTETDLLAALDNEDREAAAERASELWHERDVTSVEATGAGDGDAVEVYKDGFYATFSMGRDAEGWGVSPVGYAIYEIHDERGEYLLEDVEVEAGMNTIDRLREAVQGVVDAHREHRARRREFRRSVL